MKPQTYTEQELVELLRARQAGMTLKLYAADIGISFQFLSQILNEKRPVSNDRVLAYLAGPRKKFVQQSVYVLVDD